MPRSHRQHKRSNSKRQHESTKRMNFVADAGPGCHVAVPGVPSFVLDWERIDPNEYDDTIVPDIGIDPDKRTITLCNIDDSVKMAYITVFRTKLRGKYSILRQGETTMDKSKQGETTNIIPCTTLIVQCPAYTFCHLCHFECDPHSLSLESDVQVWNEHPDVADTCDRILAFPIRSDTSLLCTQGEGGQLTHVFRGNYHAVDVRCDIGTNLVSVGNGRVISVMDSNSSVSGIGVANLYRWNSILLQLDQDDLQRLPEGVIPSQYEVRSSPELFVEYVHIQASHVKVGDRVKQGQVIGTSGSAVRIVLV